MRDPSPAPQPVEHYRLGLQGAADSSWLASAEWADIADFPVTPVSKLGDDKIVMPASWMPSGPTQPLSQRTIHIDRTAPPGRDRDDPLVVAAERTLRRILLITWLVPRKNGRGGLKVPAPNTFVQVGNVLVRMARWTLEHRPSADGTLFGHLSPEDTAAMIGACTPALAGRANAMLRQFADRGLLTDVPPTSGPTGGAGAEPVRKGTAAVADEDDDQRVWQPFPDVFVSEFGWRCLWMAEQLGPSLIDCLSVGFAAAGGERGRTARQRSADTIAGWGWRTPAGERLDRLPFPVRWPGEKEPSERLPTEWEAIRAAAMHLQTAHASIFGLSMGARWSEVSDLRSGCLVEDDGAPARVEARTFKLVEGIGGAVRDWPLPPVAVSALRQQEKLAKVIRRPGADHLWVALNGRGENIAGGPLHSMHAPLGTLVGVFGLSDLLGDDQAHPHRWRKTLARLAAMALVGAPKILMDLFGHKTIEMTLRYVLSNPDVAAEIEQAAKEQVILLGKQVFAAATENSGPASEGIRKAAGALRLRKGETAMDVQCLDEAVDILTLNGRVFNIVRPGVVCTKSPAEAGACTKLRGAPDAGSCQVGCDHRLELAAARADADRVVSDLVARLGRPDVAENELLVARYEGQILTHLKRFDDVRRKWVADPVVAAIVTKGER